MNQLLNYLLQVMAASMLLYAYYHFVLRNKKFHRYNRFYLLTAFVISILIPFLNIPVYFSSHETESSFILQTLTSISYSTTEETVPAVIYPSTVKTNWLTWQNLICILYISIAVIVLIRILFSLRKIRSIIRNNPVEKLENINFVNTNEPGTPFSFFRWLFWNRQIELQSEKGEQIFRHELFHIQQGHSRDIIFIESLMIIFWMNPFFYLMKKEIKAIHEFLADKFATNEHNKWDYAELLLMQVLGSRQHLTNPFFHNQIKRRIAMITNPKKTSHKYLRKIMVLPVTLAILALVAFKYKTRQNTEHTNDINKNENLADSIKDTAATRNEIMLKDGIAIKKSNGDLKYLSNATVTIKSDTFPLKNTSNELLIIVDGKEYGKMKSIGDIDKEVPIDKIESINVLKGKSAVAKYGANGKNGVIEIKTKKMEPVIVTSEFITIQEKNGEKIEIRPGTSADSNGKNMVQATFWKYNSLKDTNNKVFDKVQVEAKFPGGNTAWKKYIDRNLNAAIPVKNSAPAGSYTVVIQFIVRTDGSLSDIRALTKHGYGMEDEAIRLIAKGPKWIPAKRNDCDVNAYRKQLITFQVEKMNNKTSKINSSQLNEVLVAGYREAKGRYPKDSKVLSFVGGDKEWRAYLERNINGLVPVNNGAPVGTYITVTQFLVKADGATSEFKSLTNQGYGMEEEALRVIQNAEHWEPAVVNGEKVNAYKKQPVTFIIMTDGTDEPSLTKTSLPKPDANQLSLIYPNPSNNFVTIPFNSQLAGKVEIRVTDINGNLKMIIPISFTKGANNLSVNIASLAKGMYVVNVIDATKKTMGVYKMIKL